MTGPLRAVFDCNIFFQALISPGGPSGRCVMLAFEHRITLFCSTHIVDELRETAGARKARAKFPRITDDAVSSFIESIESVGVFIRDFPEPFTYPRDPDDAHYVNLAIETRAKYLVSRDNDLLDLMDLSRHEGREFRLRFPALEIVEPQTLLRACGSLHGRRG